MATDIEQAPRTAGEPGGLAYISLAVGDTVLSTALVYWLSDPLITLNSATNLFFIIYWCFFGVGMAYLGYRSGKAFGWCLLVLGFFVLVGLATPFMLKLPSWVNLLALLIILVIRFFMIRGSKGERERRISEVGPHEP